MDRKPGVLLSMGWQRVGHNWVSELNWYSFLRSYFCFDLIFVYGTMHHSYTFRYTVFLVPLVEKTVLSPLNNLGTLVKSVYVYEDLFLGSLFLFHWSICVLLMPVPLSFDHSSFVVSYETRKCESSRFFYFSRLFWLFEVPWVLYKF